MRILQLGKFYPIQGGVEKVMFDLMDGLSSRGIHCDMLCTQAEVGVRSSVVSLRDNARIYCVKAWAKKFATMISPQMIVRLRSICSQYDIIHVHHPDPMAAFALFLSGYKGKVVLHWHSDILKQKFLLRLLMPLQNWLIHRADLIVGTTPVYVAQSPHLKKVQNKCTYLPIGIDSLHAAPEMVARIRNQYPGKRIVFSLGRMVGYKGYEYLIAAARQLSSDFVVLIGGSGPLKEKLQQQISDYHLEDKVYLLGRVSDEELPAYYEACDLYCLPSTMKTEAFAIVQIEAMSCGKPIVATRIPGSGVAWVNADGESGINVPICDSGALAEAIQKVLDDKQLYEKLSEGAKARFRKLFLKEKMIDACIAIYNRLDGIHL